MATSRQEKTYNEIIEYYNFADRLIKEVEESSHQLAQEQFEAVESVVENLEKCADQLTTQYIEYVKSGEAKEVIESVRMALNQILAKIEECRNNILIIYSKQNN